MIDSRKLGRFLVADQLIKHYPDKVMKLFQGMIVLRAEYQFDTRAVEYLAISDVFEEVESGCTAPTYYVKQTESGLELSRE